MNRIITILLALFLSINLSAKDDCIPPKPGANTMVYDNTNTLNKSQFISLNNRLMQFSNQTSNQIVVVLVRDLCGMDKYEFATELGNRWGVGQQANDNGIVILIKPTGDKGTRRTFISIGKGLEGAIPDGVAGEVVDREMIPRFKRGDFYGGVNAALQVLMPLAKGEFSHQTYSKQSKGRGASRGFYLFFVIIIIFILIKVVNARSYARHNGIDWWTAIWMGSFLGSSWGGSGRSGGWDDFNSGGGGFGGFGGGGFGGGGAGGDW